MQVRICGLSVNVTVPTFYSRVGTGTGTVSSVVDPKLFFSDPDATFQEISDPDPISDPT